MGARFWLGLLCVHLVFAFVDAGLRADASLGADDLDGLLGGAFEVYGINTEDGVNMAQLVLNPFFYYRFITAIATWNYSFLNEGVGVIFRVVLSFATLGVIVKEFGQPIGQGVSRLIGFIR